MEETKISTFQKEEEKNPILEFFSNLLAAIQLRFLQKNGADSESEVAISPEEQPVKTNPSVVEDKNGATNVLALPRQSLAPLRFEAEPDEGQRSTNPVLLWQVYALGGFLVMRWAWTRWNRKKGKKKSDDEPPPAHD